MGEPSTNQQPQKQDKMKAIILFLPILIFGCDHVHVGTVVDKHIEPAHYYTTVYYTTVGKVHIPHYIRHWDDEDYVVTIHGVDDGGDTTNEDYYVSYEEYHSINIGYCFNDTIDRVFQDCETGSGDY
jgi:hypothetical protein